MPSAVDRRPGAWSTHRGRKVVIGSTLAVVASFVAMSVSNNATSGASSMSSATVTDPLASPTLTTAADGTTESIEIRTVDPAVPDVFHLASGVATSSDPLAGGGDAGYSSSSPTEVPFNTSDDEYTSVAQVANSSVSAFTTWTWTQKPDAFVNNIPSLTPAYRANLLASTTKVWPSIVRSKATSQPRVQTVKVTPLTINRSAKIAKVAVSVQRIGTEKGFPQRSEMITYEVTAVQPNGVWLVNEIHT